jgi:hypothetical protein
MTGSEHCFNPDNEHCRRCVCGHSRVAHCKANGSPFGVSVPVTDVHVTGEIVGIWTPPTVQERERFLTEQLRECTEHLDVERQQKRAAERERDQYRTLAAELARALDRVLGCFSRCPGWPQLPVKCDNKWLLGSVHEEMRDVLYSAAGLLLREDAKPLLEEAWRWPMT